MQRGSRSWNRQIGARRLGQRVKSCAVLDQRPDFGGEESIDKNKQTMTIPARTVATNMTWTNLRCCRGAIFWPNVL
jgi:hypothetical protein